MDVAFSSKIPKVNEVVLFNVKIVPFLLCILSSFIIEKYRFRTVFHGADAVPKLYGRTKDKSLSARAQFFSHPNNHVTIVIIRKHVIGGVGLSKVMTNVVRWIWKT